MIHLAGIVFRIGISKILAIAFRGEALFESIILQSKLTKFENAYPEFALLSLWNEQSLTRVF